MVIYRSDLNRMAAATFKKVLNPEISINRPETLEVKYWKELKLGSVYKLDAPVVTIAHSKRRGQYVVGEGYRLHLYKTHSDRLVCSFGRFKTSVRCCSFRKDGELLAAAEENGVVRVFNMNNLHVKAALRLYKGHRGSVSAVRFLTGGTQLASGSHDGTVRLWDLPTQACTAILSLRSSSSASSSASATAYPFPILDPRAAGQVGEQVRGLDVSHRSPHLLAAGSFDGTVRLFDLRRDAAAGPVVSVEHTAPLTGVALSPDDNLLVAPGSRAVRVWALNGGASCDPLAALEGHHGTATCVGFGKTGTRLLSAGLDGLVKVYNLASCEEVHHWEIASRIISMSIAEDDRSLLLGCDDGLLHTRRPRLPEEQTDDLEASSAASADNDAAPAGRPRPKEAPLPSVELDRAIIAAAEARQLPSLTPPPGASARERKRHLARVKLQRAKVQKFTEQAGATFHPALQISQDALHYAQHDRRLQKFRHTKALMASLAEGVRRRNPERTLAMLQELARRRALKAAIAGQDAKTGLNALLCFIRRHIWRPTFSPTLQHVLKCVLEVYRGGGVLLDDALASHLRQLEKTIETECRFVSSAHTFVDLLESLEKGMEEADGT